jgi:hypothetical protein
LGDVVREGVEEAHLEHHGYSVAEVDTPVVLGVEAVEGGDLAVFVDGGEEVQGPRGWVLGEGAVDSEGGVELP